MRGGQSPGPVVVKVGGSLFDWPELGPRLTAWLGRLSTRQVLLVPGGGRLADGIRTLDRCHGLGEERAHWLALAALALGGRFLASLLPGAVIVADPGSCGEPWGKGRLAVLDTYAFAQGDEGRPGALPHSWAVTSDALAARAAVVAGASQLILLKSVDLPLAIDWTEAGRRGLVDPRFAEVVGRSLPVEFVNFRAWQP